MYLQFRRYGNRKYANPGTTVYGIYTQDYSFNRFQCQVLITVPVCLESLLLAPECQEWMGKVKYAILGTDTDRIDLMQMKFIA